MSLETDFRDLCVQTVTVLARTGRNSDGSDSFTGTASTYRARVANTKKWVRNSEGVATQASHMAWILSTGIIAADSKITLPDGSTPPLLSIANYPDQDGGHHVEAMFG